MLDHQIASLMIVSDKLFRNLLSIFLKRINLL